MKNTSRRILGCLLTVILLLQPIFTSVYAQTEMGENTVQGSGKVELNQENATNRTEDLADVPEEKKTDITVKIYGDLPLKATDGKILLYDSNNKAEKALNDSHTMEFQEIIPGDYILSLRYFLDGKEVKREKALHVPKDVPEEMTAYVETGYLIHGQRLFEVNPVYQEFTLKTADDVDVDDHVFQSEAVIEENQVYLRIREKDAEATTPFQVKFTDQEKKEHVLDSKPEASDKLEQVVRLPIIDATSDDSYVCTYVVNGRFTDATDREQTAESANETFVLKPVLQKRNSIETVQKEPVQDSTKTENKTSTKTPNTDKVPNETDARGKTSTEAIATKATVPASFETGANVFESFSRDRLRSETEALDFGSVSTSLLRMSRTDRSTADWDVSFTNNPVSPTKMQVTNVSLTETGTNFVWTITLNQTVKWQKNNTFQWITVAESGSNVAFVDITKTGDTLSKSLTANKYRTSMAMQPGEHTYTLTTAKADDTKFVMTFKTGTSSDNSPPTVAYRESTTLTLSAKKKVVPQKGDLQIAVTLPEAYTGVAKVSLTGQAADAKEVVFNNTTSGILQIPDLSPDAYTVTFHGLSPAVTNWSVDSTTKNVTVWDGLVSEVSFDVTKLPDKSLNIRVLGTDGQPVSGVTLSLQDDKGKTCSGTTLSDGTLALHGEFTKNQTYPTTIVSVPSGYNQPNQTVAIAYHPKADDPSTSTISEIVIEKSDFQVGELSLGTNAEDSDITLAIYEQPGDTLKENVVVPAGGNIKRSGFVPYAKYKIRVIASSGDLYETGAETSFIYEPDKPFVKVFLTPKTGETNTLSVRFHEKDTVGPLTTLLDGQTLTLKVNNVETAAVIQDGVATFLNPMAGEYTISGTAPSASGYELVKNSPFTLDKASGYQDWVLRKTSTTVYLRVKPPEGKAFTDAMTAKVVDVVSGTVVSGPKKIGDGLLIFEDITSGKDYNIVYENVPEKWTHATALKTPFHIPINAVETAVADQFGYYDPAFEQTNFSVKVVDNVDVPVDGFTFVIKDASGNIIPNSTITTGLTGQAETMLPKLAPGTYTVENTVAKPGYQKVQLAPFTITATDFNIAAEAKTGKELPGNTADINITVTDMKGQPVVGQWLSFYKTKDGETTLVTDQLQTDSSGKTFITALSVDETATYKFQLTEPTLYELVPVTGETEAIVLQPGANRQFDLQIRTKTGYGKITGKVVTAENEPAPNMVFTVKKQGTTTAVDSFRSFNDGKNESKVLPFGVYDVILTETDVYKLAPGESATKTVTINEAHPNPIVAFQVEKKTYEIGNAGSVQVEGTMLKGKDGITKTSWITTIDKFASNNPLIKRKAQNRLIFPANQMIQPSQPMLMRKIGSGDFVEVPLSGQWVRKGENYEFVDENSRTDEWTSEKVIYQYSFSAVGVDSVPEYALTGQTDIISSDPREIIKPMAATYTLTAADAKPAINLNGQGNGQVDIAVEEVEWNYDGQVDLAVPGKLTFEIALPEGAGLQPFNNIIKPIVRTVDQSGQEIDVPYDIILDPATGHYNIIFDARSTRSFDFNVRFNTDVDSNQTVSDFKLNTSYLFEADNVAPERYLPLTLTAAKQIPLPGNVTEVISTCDSGRHKVNLHGMVSGDGKYIQWQAKVTNLDVENKRRPMRIDVHVGDGLGDAEILSINSVGKSFPFITKGTSVNNGSYVFDVAEPRNAGKDFRVHAEYTDHYLNNQENISHVGKYAYISRFGDIGLGRMRNYKSDVQQNEYFFHSGATIDAANVSAPRDQRLRSGDYVVFNFRTPITDFTRMRQGGLGYTVNLDTGSYDVKTLSDETGGLLCRSDTELTLRREPFAGDIIPGRIFKTEVGEIYAQGKYINEGRDIEWQIEAQPLRKKKLLEENPQDLKIEYKLVNKNNVAVDTGLGPITSRRPEKVEDKSGFSFSEVTQPDGGVLTLKQVDLGESLKYTFITPVTEEKPEYRLEVKGFYGPADTPLTDEDRPDEHILYVSVEGKSIIVQAAKKWDNVYDNAEKPTITLHLKRQKISGEIEDIATEVLHTPKTEKYIDAVFETCLVDGVEKPIPRFDENGYRYNYIISEDSVPGYRTNIIRMNGEGSLWQITNIRDDSISITKDPIDYTNASDGRYPTTNQQDGPDIRNADTKLLNDKHEDYKIEYEDAIVGKSGQQTDVPGMFDMKLTMEGKSKGKVQGIDVVFVLDNSQSMTKAFDSPGVEEYEARTKIYALRKTMEQMLEEVLTSPFNRAGIVNFGTSTRRKNPSDRKSGYKRIPADGSSSTKVDMLYNYYDKMELTSSRADLRKAIPTAAHYVANLGMAGDGTADVSNRSHADTNIAAGIAEAGEILYPKGETSNRKKIMVVISDGMPTASLKLKNYPLDPTIPLKDNLVYTGKPVWDTSPYSGYIMCNNVYYLMGYSYLTDNGKMIDNNAAAAIAVSDYYQKRDQNLEIFSVGIGREQVNYENQGKNTNGITEPSSVLMERTLRAITTNHDANYYEANNADELSAYISQLQDKLKSNSIIDGEVTDPMGSQVDLRVAHGFKPASDETLQDGDFYLSDNLGNYMAPDGSIKNVNDMDYRVTVPTYHRDTLLHRPILKYGPETYQLDTFGQPLMVHDPDTGEMVPNSLSSGIYRYVLVIHKQSSAEPRPNWPYDAPLAFEPITSLTAAENAIKSGKKLILLRNTDSGKAPFVSDVGLGTHPKEPAPKSRLRGVQVVRDGNGLKLTGLNLGTAEEVTLRYRINLRTDDPSFVPDFYYPGNETTTLNPQPANGNHYRYFPIPSVKGPAIPLEIQKQWLDSDGNDYIRLVDKDGQPITDPEKKQALTLAFQQKLEKSGVDAVTAQIYQYQAKVNEEGVPVNSNGQPLGPEESPIRDDTTKKLLREERITKGTTTPFWTVTNKDLPAYDNQGRLFLYDVEEKAVPSGFTCKEIKHSTPMISYDKANGYQVGGTQGATYAFVMVNQANEEPKGRFQILKVDAQDTAMILPGATFELSQDNVVLKSQITTTDGKILFDDLPPGRYTLKEVRAPDGYQLDSTKNYDVLIERIGVTQEVKVTLSYQVDGQTVILSPSKEGTITQPAEYTITNRKLEIPFTGYRPKNLLILLLAASAMLMLIRYVYKVNKEVGGS